MPIPLIPLIAAGIVGAGGGFLGVKGVRNSVKASKKAKLAQERNAENLEKLKDKNIVCCSTMDYLGETEMDILQRFNTFSDLMERVQNKPMFDELSVDDVKIPTFTMEEIRETAMGAGMILGSAGGAAIGTLGGFAASGATTAAVMAWGTASTGAAISSLSGVAATNATLAALGGGAIAAGGGGMAAGAIVLGSVAAGVGILIGGVIFTVVGKSLSQKAEKTWEQMLENELKINKICKYLSDLQKAANDYRETLIKLYLIFTTHLTKFQIIVDYHREKLIDWNSLTEEEQLTIKNTVLLVSVLYNMCKVKMVKGTDEEKQVNTEDIENAKMEAGKVIGKFM